MSDLEVGQVLALRIRFNNQGLISPGKHPYLIVAIDFDLNFVEVAQIDSLLGKEYKAAMRSNKTIFCDEPHETVIDKDSYVQLDNIIRIENCPELLNYRRQPDKLSAGKLSDVLAAYIRYHQEHEIDDIKNVYMDKTEILSLN